ncbi:MAG: GspE/PulE family protein [bacterium]
MVSENNKWLIGTLLDKKIITADQLTQVLARQKETKENLEKILLDLRLVKDKELEALRRKQSFHDETSLLGRVDPEALKLVPETVARRYSVIPLSKEGNILTLAMTDLNDVVAIDTVRTISGCEIKAAPASEKDIMTAVERYYSGSPDMETVLLDLVKVNGHMVQPEIGGDLGEVKLKANDPPVVKFVNLLLLEAVERRASDIHIEPAKGRASLRVRIDGVLQDMTPPPKTMHSAIISRVKILSQLDIAERRLPQDGRCVVTIGDREVDIRVSTFPTLYGEKVVMRLLDREKISLGLEELGLSPDKLAEFEKVLKRPYGMILETGPTGCGKTTTLYAGLQYINSPEKNIVTIEDPIEYDLAGINQTQVKPGIGLDFARGLRAILRQDPDVILVGEIRDRETAQIAIRAALTGHLVFSTLHTNDAIGAIAQLQYFGIEPYLIGSAVDLVIAQRLIRRVCPNCREYYTLSKEALHRLGLVHKEKDELKLPRSKGCRRCTYTGYFGRTAVFQFFEITPPVKRLIFEGADMHALRAEATSQGMKTLREAAIEKLRQGLTTVEEVLSVTLQE